MGSPSSHIPIPHTEKKGYKVRGVRDGKGNREVDMDRQLEKIKKDLMEDFKDVFKVKLEKTDRIDAPPVKIMIDQERMEKEKPSTQYPSPYQLIFVRLLTPSWMTWWRRALLRRATTRQCLLAEASFVRKSQETARN